MRSLRLLPLLGCLSVVSACSGDDSLQFPYGGMNSDQPDLDDDDDDTDTTGDDTASGGDDTAGGGGDSGDTGGIEIPEAEFDEPGDIGGTEPDTDGVAEVILTDISGDSNTEQEFYLLLINTGTTAMDFELNMIRAEETSSGKDSKKGFPPPAATPARPAPDLSAFRAQLRDAIRSGAVSTYSPPTGPPTVSLTSADIGNEPLTFKVRNDLEDEDSVEEVNTVLWALADGVAIWVDDDVPIDWDVGCDGTVDVVDPEGAYGFNNCDLDTVAEIVDTNILPNLTGYFGSLSDVDENELVNIVITREINRLPLTSDDEDIQESFIGSYADPEVDLNEFNQDTNPNTNLGEVVFIFSPDPNGFVNPNAKVSIEEYTDVEVLSQISQSIYRLISYNEHALENKGDAEEAWGAGGDGGPGRGPDRLRRAAVRRVVGLPRLDVRPVADLCGRRRLHRHGRLRRAVPVLPLHRGRLRHRRALQHRADLGHGH